LFEGINSQKNMAPGLNFGPLWQRDPSIGVYGGRLIRLWMQVHACTLVFTLSFAPAKPVSHITAWTRAGFLNWNPRPPLATTERFSGATSRDLY